MRDRIPVVHRLVRPEVHDHRLGADREGPRELLVVDRRLQVHEHLAGLVVGLVQVVLVVDAGDAPPAAAVERLHVERVAQVGRDGVEVERLVVLRRRVGPPGVVDRVLVRDQDGPRDLQAEPHHRAVGRVLLHGLEGERAVEQVGPVHERGLLEPLAGVVVPVREAVDDETRPDRVGQLERLDGEPFGLDLVDHARGVGDRPDASQDRLERLGPVLLGAEEQSDEVARTVGHRRPPGAGRARPDDRIGGTGAAVARGPCVPLFTRWTRVGHTPRYGCPVDMVLNPQALGDKRADKVRPGQV